MKKYILSISMLCLTLLTYGQTYVYQTFKDRRVINTHSTETLQAKVLDIRIGHRFGDLAGANGGWATFYGLENAADVLIGAEYGLTNNLTVGLNRTKGSGPFRQLVNGHVKYRLLTQQEEKMPISLALMGNVSGSTMSKSTDATSLFFFDKMAHRFSYVGQVLVARKFSDKFSLQVHTSFSHRNIVAFDDQNDLISVGFASRYQLSKVVAVLTDLNYVVNNGTDAGANYQPALGVGFEFDTGGHIFQLNLTNSQGIIENDYIPFTTSNWLDGQFRFGFTISRLFRL